MKTTTTNLLALVMLGCVSVALGDDAVAPATANVQHSCCATSSSAGTACLADKSLYWLESVWTNDFAQPVRLAGLKGRPHVLTMFFANCQYACPLLVHKMKLIAAALPPEVRTNVGFTLVSFDSKRDTPAALHAYRARQQLENNWNLLHGEPDEVLELAALLGINFKEDAQGQFTHSNIITVLNADGEIVHQTVGLSLETAETVRQVQLLVRCSTGCGNGDSPR
jgi:protein SCO1/2